MTPGRNPGAGWYESASERMGVSIRPDSGQSDGARRSSGASSHARFGAVSFIHRFGAPLNRHVHYHSCVIDRVFEPVEDVADVHEAVRL